MKLQIAFSGKLIEISGEKFEVLIKNCRFNLDLPVKEGLPLE